MNMYKKVKGQIFHKIEFLLTPVMGLVKTLLVKTLLREKIQVKERKRRTCIWESIVVHFKVGDIPCFGYESTTQFFQLVYPIMEGIYYPKGSIPIWCQFAF